MVVLLSRNSFIFSNISFWDILSKAEVASSNIIILESLRRALAIAILCFCPPDSFTPFSPIIVSKPFFSSFIKS